MSEPKEWTEKRVRELEQRLRGQYPVGPILANGEPEFGWRQFESGLIRPIQAEAADALSSLLARVKELEGENKYLRHTLRLEADTDSAYSDLGTE